MKKEKQTVLDFVYECWQADFDPASAKSTLSKNCLHQKTIGKSIGIESFISDCYDWSNAFPDYKTTIVSIEEYRNVIICDIARTGTHLYPYVSTNFDKKSVLTSSNFFSSIEGQPPTQRSYKQPAKVIFAFERGKISQLSIEEDPLALPLQLGFKKDREPPFLPKNKSVILDALQESLPDSLTLREIECLSLVCCGHSAKHTAQILKISYRTVETFLHHTYKKLDCFGKQEAIEFLYEKNLFTLGISLGNILINER
jgi:DNA-binding CsgD family transcriptional regulator